MKRLLLSLLAVLYTFAMYATSQKEIPLKEKPTQEAGATTRGAVILSANASIIDNLLVIDFLYALGDVTVTITKLSTGEVVYSGIYNSPQSVEIDLSAEDTGLYRLDLSSGPNQLFGCFQKE